MKKLTLNFQEGNKPQTSGTYVVRYTPAASRKESTGVGYFNGTYWDIHGKRGLLKYIDQFEAGRGMRFRKPNVLAFAKVS